MAIIWLLHHRHAPDECAVAYAAWTGFESPLRNRTAISSCVAGGHAIWWMVPVPDQEEALAMLPPFVARRTRAIRISEVLIP